MKAPTPFALLQTRRLWPLTLTQACGALNDNLVRNAMIVLALFRLGTGGAGLAALAGALFMAPYILLSATSGQLADRFAKHRVILAAKIAEVALMAATAAAFLTESLPGLLAVLFGLGVQAAIFGPVKYGILPEQLHENELVAGNGVIEGATFLAIVAGTVLGGALILAPRGNLLVGAAGIGLSLLGLFAASRVLPAPAADPALRVGWNLFAETWRVTRHAMAARPMRLSILGLSWFWVVGATLMTELPVLARDTLGATGQVLTLLLTVFAVGVGIGSIACARLLKGEISARHVPFAAIGISVFLWDFAHACAAGRTQGLISVAAVLAAPAGWRMLADLLALAICGGLFSVPLYAIIQDLSAPSHRSRTIAANNVMNALFMVVGAGAAAAFAAGGFTPVRTLEITAAANFAVALWSVRLLPHEVYRAVFRRFFNTFYGVEVTGLENYKAGEKLVIVSNHLSFGDACLISAFLPGNPAFAIDVHQSRRWYARVATAAVRLFPVDIRNPYAVKRMIEAVRDDGEQLVVFPEGRLTQTGALMKIYEGAGVVADKSGAKVLPVSIDGLQFTPLGRMAGKLKLRWFPRLRLAIHPAVDLTPPNAESLSPRQRREEVGRALHDVMVNAAFRSKNTSKTLFAALLDARRDHGGKSLIAEDINREPISYDRLVLGAAALGRNLAQYAALGETIGLMMPNANATLVAFIGLGAFGRVPAMLNFTSGADGMLSACAAAQIKTIISSRAFIEKAKLGKIVERMEPELTFIWLEDVRGAIGLAAKLRAKWDAAFARRLPGARLPPDSPAVVLFTSGSEGVPKGVVLSHRNILANCAQLSSIVDFNPSDRVFSALPMFHSLGLVDGTLLPLLYGVRTFLYPSPLHYRIVPSLIYDTDATICFGTDTFLNGWARYAHPYDFYRMRYIFAGAEKVRDETKRLFAEKFGVRLLEGYGATETSPVLAMNTAMYNRPGTVGRLLPGMAHRLEKVPGVNAGGRLSVSGPNVMLGYMRATAPGVIETPADGWYDTGDIVDIDPHGYVSITGRAKRFAKIAGEMVSMSAAESLVASLWPDAQHAVLAQPDARKGEQLLLLTTRRDAAARDIVAHARARGMAEIAVPRSVLVVDAIPLLGTGKTDYPAVQRLAETLQAAHPGEAAAAA
jgi:acyl-[acyl-carrier-protein]-phospholipid O-acyltransferase/long-chain-fatty-acid--[acyl-carrier-protein] ligase